MGRKGVSKRKPVQTKTKPLTGNTAGGSVSSALQNAEKQPAKTFDTGKDAPSTRGGVDHKKSPKKG